MFTTLADNRTRTLFLFLLVSIIFLVNASNLWLLLLRLICLLASSIRIRIFKKELIWFWLDLLLWKFVSIVTDYMLSCDCNCVWIYLTVPLCASWVVQYLFIFCHLSPGDSQKTTPQPVKEYRFFLYDQRFSNWDLTGKSNLHKCKTQ